MPLAIPQIESVFSVWSKSLFVTGALPGATILVHSIGPSSRDIAKGPAGGGADWISLLPGETIKPNDKLIVRQELSGQISNWTPSEKAYDPTPVPNAASDLLPVQILSQLWECGRYVYIRGAYPGTQIEFDYGVPVVAKGDAPSGEARLQLHNALSANSIVTARQTAPIGPGQPSAAKVEPLPFPRSVKFPAPQIRTPIRGCETAVFISGVYDGADVTLHRTLNPEETAGFDLGGLWFRLAHPLKYNATNTEYISAVQAMQTCERFGNESTSVPVGPPEALQPGIGPLCADGRTVQIFNLQPGSILHVNVGGIVYDLMAPWDASSYSFDVDPPLVPGTVTAVQEICGLTSPPASRDVDAHPAVMQKPVLQEPLYHCARLVRVSDVHPGSEVQVYARTKTGEGPISGRKIFNSNYDEIDVAPHLNTNDLVWVVATGCGTRLESEPRKKVVAHPTIDAPAIQEKVVSGASAVTVVKVIPTATVYVYLLEQDTWNLIGSKTYADGTATIVLLNRTLKTGDKIAAVQSYCGQTTARGPITTVVKPAPLQPQIIFPTNGSANVPYQGLVVTWKDPGAGSERAAESYKLWLWETSKPIPAPTLLTTTTYTVVTPLHVGSYYNLRIVSVNSTGESALAQFTFSTLAPTPVLKNFDQSSMVLAGENFPPNMAASIHVTHDIPGSINIGDFTVQNDNRSKDLPVTSDGTGKLNQNLDLYALLDHYDALVISAGNTVQLSCQGPLKGEYVIMKASYVTPKGPVESGVLKFTWTKDNHILLP